MSDRWPQLVAAVERALAACPPDAATLIVNGEERSIHIQPRNGDAASVEARYSGTDEWAWG